MALKITFLGLLLLLAVEGSPATADGPECPKTKFMSRASFPENMLFGAASAALQYEGAAKEGCKGPTMWEYYAFKHPERTNHNNTLVAVDFYNRYKEDIQLLKGMGFTSFRFSIDWTRIFPHGRKDKGVSKVGVQFYHDLLDELIANGIEPLVTVFHWETPQDLEDEYGGFLSEKIVKDFAEFANFTFHEYCDKVKYWITLNEPWVYSRAGYDIGKKAPGRCSPYVHRGTNNTCLGGNSGTEPYKVSHNLLLAHAEAVQEFRKCGKCNGGKIGIAHSPVWFEPYDLEEHPDREARIERAIQFIMGWHLHPTTYGDYPEIMKQVVKDRLPKFTEEQKAKLRNSCDYVGMNYYYARFSALANVNPEEPSWESDSLSKWEVKNPGDFVIGSQPSTGAFPVYAKGLRRLLNYIKDNYGDPEVIIAENGYGEILKEQDNLPDALNDHNRKYYFQRHLMNLHDAICEDKVKVIGYFAWSFLDNFEWQDGYKTRFGLYYVDYKNNLTRHEKVSAKWMREEFFQVGKASSKIVKDKDEL